MTLRKLTRDDASAFLEFANDFEPGNKNSLVRTPDAYHAFFDLLSDYELGRNLKQGYVRSTNFYLFDERGSILARLTYRPELSESTLIEGGHIGYEVRKSRRNQGLASAMVKQFLESLNPEETSRILITCDVDNIASEKVIVRNGGKLESIEKSPRTGKMAKRFWIELRREDSPPKEEAGRWER